MAAFATSWLTRGATGRGSYSFIDPAVMLDRANAPQISHTCKINSEGFYCAQMGHKLFVCASKINYFSIDMRFQY